MARSFLPERFIERPFGLWPNLFVENLLPLSEEASVGKGVSIYEKNNLLHVDVPVPGLNSEDIEVSLNKGVLLVKGEAKEEEQDKNTKVYRFSERRCSYSIALPTQTDETQEPQAVVEQGILKVSIPIAKQAETKKIKVKTESSKK